MRSRLSAVLGVLVLAATGFAAEPPPAPDAALIVFEIRVLTVAETVFDQAGVEFDPKTVLLTDAKLRALLEAVQTDRRSNVMQSPKVTIEDGQQAVIQATEQRSFLTRLEAMNVKGESVLVPKEVPTELGSRIAVGGRVSADGKSITARIKYTDSQVVGDVRLVPVVTYVSPMFKDGSKGPSVPFTQYLQVPQIETVMIEKNNLTIPSGAHAILAGPTRVKEMRQEFGPPVLSKIPYLNRMYKNVGIGRESARIYLIVSPKVLDTVAEPTTQR